MKQSNEKKQTYNFSISQAAINPNLAILGDISRNKRVMKEQDKMKLMNPKSQLSESLKKFFGQIINEKP